MIVPPDVIVHMSVLLDSKQLWFELFDYTVQTVKICVHIWLLWNYSSAFRLVRELGVPHVLCFQHFLSPMVSVPQDWGTPSCCV